MISRLNKIWMAHKWGLLIILSAGGTQLAGCSGCKSSGLPSSVPLTTLGGQCILGADIRCTCSGGGILSSCSNASQTIIQGTIAPGLAAPCPATFNCNDFANCSTGFP
ncbi:hypothetical protein [Legionella sp.]|uniref:hypothetical protein n=1 Tax=Legionella sp. TaxID=459 RepID=UPI003CB6F192